jgi:pentatricopeptide repeat protein
MRRVGPGEQGDHLTQNLIGRVGELWADMEAMGRKPDYKTYNELIRAYGKAGRIKELMVLFEHMCDSLWLRVVASEPRGGAQRETGTTACVRLALSQAPRDKGVQ